jgi:hypothetical protein
MDLWGILGLQIRGEMTEEIDLCTKAQREIVEMIINLWTINILVADHLHREKSNLKRDVE